MFVLKRGGGGVCYITGVGFGVRTWLKFDSGPTYGLETCMEGAFYDTALD